MTGAFQAARHFGEAASMPRGAVAARRHVQVGIALNDIDDVEHVIRRAAQPEGTAVRLGAVIFVELKSDLSQHRLEMEGRRRCGNGGFAGFDRSQLGRIGQDVGEALLNRGEVVGDLAEIRRADAAG